MNSTFMNSCNHKYHISKWICETSDPWTQEWTSVFTIQSATQDLQPLRDLYFIFTVPRAFMLHTKSKQITCTRPLLGFWSPIKANCEDIFILQVSDVTGLDASKEAQIEATRDLDGVQSNRGRCEREGDGEDFLGIHHQSGWLSSVFQKVLKCKANKQSQIKKSYKHIKH